MLTAGRLPVREQQRPLLHRAAGASPLHAGGPRRPGVPNRPQPFSAGSCQNRRPWRTPSTKVLAAMGAAAAALLAATAVRPVCALLRRSADRRSLGARRRCPRSPPALPQRTELHGRRSRVTHPAPAISLARSSRAVPRLHSAVLESMKQAERLRLEDDGLLNFIYLQGDKG